MLFIKFTSSFKVCVAVLMRYHLFWDFTYLENSYLEIHDFPDITSGMLECVFVCAYACVCIYIYANIPKQLAAFTFRVVQGIVLGLNTI